MVDFQGFAAAKTCENPPLTTRCGHVSRASGSQRADGDPPRRRRCPKARRPAAEHRHGKGVDLQCRNIGGPTPAAHPDIPTLGRPLRTQLPATEAVSRRRGCRAGGPGRARSARMISRTTGGGVAAAEEQVAEQVAERVALGPLEVAVRAYAGGVAQGEQDRGDGVGRGGALGAQDPVAADLDAAHAAGRR